MVGDGEWVAVLAVAELELAFEVSAPQIVGDRALRERRSGSPMARPADRLDQAVAMEDGVDRAFGGNPDVAVEAADQEFADLARAPMRLLALEVDNQLLDLRRQLVGIAHRPPRAVAQRLEAMLLVAVKDFVAGLARDSELPADIAHRLPVQQPADKPKTLVHHRTLLPGHRHLPQIAEGVTHVSGTICHLCLGSLTNRTFSGA